MSDCPRCFRKLAHDRKAFRCTSGKCGVEFQEATVEVLGYQEASTPIVVADDPRQLPGSISCSRCGEYEQQEVCLHCYADIPQNWRSANVLTVTIAGARGAGKTVYIGVLIEVLRRYLKRIGRILEAVNRSTDDTYNAVYRVPLFEENMMLPERSQLSMMLSLHNGRLCCGIYLRVELGRISILRSVTWPERILKGQQNGRRRSHT